MVVIVALLCFIMGFQNAIITKISGARIRTTHITGLVTDAGIEIGKAAYWNRSPASPHLPPVTADIAKLTLLCALIGLFFIGGVSGALLFAHIGFAARLRLHCRWPSCRQPCSHRSARTSLPLMAPIAVISKPNTDRVIVNSLWSAACRTSSNSEAAKATGTEEAASRSAKALDHPWRYRRLPCSLGYFYLTGSGAPPCETTHLEPSRYSRDRSSACNIG